MVNRKSFPFPRTIPSFPVNPYGETKLIMERALKWYGHAYPMGWIALRYFNVARGRPRTASSAKQTSTKRT